MATQTTTISSADAFYKQLGRMYGTYTGGFVGFIVLLAILIGYALASGDGQDSAIGTHRSNNSAAGFVHSFATAHTMVGS